MVVLSTINVSNNGLFSVILDIDHLYSRDGNFFKNRLPSSPSATPRQVRLRSSNHAETRRRDIQDLSCSYQRWASLARHMRENHRYLKHGHVWAVFV